MSKGRALLLVHYAGYLLQFRGALVKELVARGYRTTVGVPAPDAMVREGLARLGAECRAIELSRTGLNPLADLRSAGRVRSLLDELRPQLVIATGIKPILHGMPAARDAGAAIRVPLFAGLGALVRPASMGQRVLGVAARPLFRRALRCASHVVTQNPEDTRLLEECFGRDLAVPPITTEGSGVDLNHFAVAPPAADATVLMTARIVAEKGVWEYLQAAKSIHARRPEVRFLLAGFLESRSRGIRPASFLEGCREAGVEHVGHVDDIRPLMAACSVFVLPSYYGEGRPRSIQEALAMGRPVVTTDNVGCRDSIKDGVHGRIVPVRDPAALAAAIEDVMGWDDRPALAVACRRLAERRYRASDIARGWLDQVGA